MNAIKKDALDHPELKAREILTKHTTGLPKAVSLAMPSANVMMRPVYTARAPLKPDYGPIPKTLAELKIPNELKFFSNGLPFCLFDSAGTYILES